MHTLQTCWFRFKIVMSTTVDNLLAINVEILNLIIYLVTGSTFNLKRILMFSDIQSITEWINPFLGGASLTLPLRNTSTMHFSFNELEKWFCETQFTKTSHNRISNHFDTRKLNRGCRMTTKLSVQMKTVFSKIVLNPQPKDDDCNRTGSVGC